MRKHKHQYLYVNHRGFGNEFSIYTLPADWAPRTWFDPNYRPVEQSVISRREAVARWHRYRRYDVAHIGFYRCPFCGYAPVEGAEDPLAWPPITVERFRAEIEGREVTA